MYNRSMLISSKSTYALRVMTYLAKNNTDNGYISISDLSSQLNISRKYLEAIMTALNKNNIVDACLGKFGGYRLNKRPEEYSLMEILKVTEGQIAPVACLEKDCKPCEMKETCCVIDTCVELHDMINAYFQKKTLADLMVKENV